MLINNIKKKLFLSLLIINKFQFIHTYSNIILIYKNKKEKKVKNHNNNNKQTKQSKAS